MNELPVGEMPLVDIKVDLILKYVKAILFIMVGVIVIIVGFLFRAFVR